MRKSVLVSVVLLLFVSSLVLVGCGGQKDSGSPPAGEKQQAGTQTTTQDGAGSVADLLGKGKNVEGMSYDYTMTSGNTSINGKVWMQDKKVKTEAVMQGQKVITIVDGDVAYVYHPDENAAFKMTLDQAQQTETPSDFIEDVDTRPDKYKIVDSVVYDGVKCKIVEVTGADGQEQVKMWVREDYGIPVRVESSGPDGEKMLLVYKNLKLGPQPSGTFELPAGVEVMDMSEMIKQIPQAGQLPGSN